MKYELEIIADIVKTKGGKSKTIVRNDRIKKMFDLDTLEIEEYIDISSGRHIKKYTTVTINGNSYKINKPYEELKALILDRSIPVLGLMAKSKTYK